MNNGYTQERETSKRALRTGAYIVNRSSGYEGDGEWSKGMSMMLSSKGSVRDADEDGQSLGGTRPKRVHRQ